MKYVSALLTDLAACVPAHALRTAADDLAFYGADRCRGEWTVAPAAIVLPGSEAEVQAVVRCCMAHGAAMVPSGGRTGLAGGAAATSGEVVVSLERMHRVHEVNVHTRLLTCDAGTTLEAVQHAALAHGLLYPVDYASKGSAQIGGSIATNAGGVRVLRYGTTRAWVSGVRVVLASGDAVALGGSLVKNNTGYDLMQLFIGSEGTLGIVTQATLRLCAPPAGEVVALCALPSLAHVLQLFRRARALPLLAFECFDHGCLASVLRHRGLAGAGPFDAPAPYYALLALEVGPQQTDDAAQDMLMATLSAAQEAEELTDAVLAQTPAQARELWAYREDVSESLHHLRPHKSDVALPLSAIEAFVHAWTQALHAHLPGYEARIFGHIGDGNLHLNVVPPPQQDPAAFTAAMHAFDTTTYGLVQQHEGSISAEHGVGLLKRAHLHYTRSTQEIALMRAIKRAFDPLGVFNPGKIF